MLLANYRASLIQVSAAELRFVASVERCAEPLWLRGQSPRGQRRQAVQGGGGRPPAHLCPAAALLLLGLALPLYISTKGMPSSILRD